jgi:hypothetical protein
MADRWIGLNELADETGMSVRNLQYIRAQEPGVLVTRQRGSLTQYQQPACAINLRNREAEKARREHAPTVSLDEARTRKALAEAELAEMDLAVRRGDLVGVSDYDNWFKNETSKWLAYLNTGAFEGGVTVAGGFDVLSGGMTVRAGGTFGALDNTNRSQQLDKLGFRTGRIECGSPLPPAGAGMRSGFANSS